MSDRTHYVPACSRHGTDGLGLSKREKMEQIAWPDGRCFVRTDELARLSGLSASFWHKLRMTNRGPKYTKAGAAVLYPVDELDRWFASNTVANTSERTAT
jgi:hypothetical protein